MKACFHKFFAVSPFLVLLVGLLATDWLRINAQGQPAPPSGVTNPAAPASLLILTNVATVWTNAAVQTGSQQFTSVTLYGGTNALTGALIVSWNQYTNAGVQQLDLYYGTVSGSDTNIWMLPVSTTTALFYGGLLRGTTYWFYVTAVTPAGVQSPPSNVAVAQD